MKLKKMLQFLLLIMIMSFHNAQMIKGQEEKNINIKIEPSKYNRLTLDDLDQVKMEILHDMNQHIKNIEDEMIDNQRLSDKSINSWSKSGAPIFIPNNPIYQEYSIPSMKDIVLGDKVNEPVVGYVQDDAKGKVTIWLYLLKTYDSSNYGFDNPICFTSSNWVKKGIWKYTIPSGYNMVRIRYNTYSDGSNSVTAKFWETHLIPEKYFIFPNELSGGNPKMRVLKDSIIASSSLAEI